MIKIRRYLFSRVKADLPQKMVFITGPRQSGKTTLGLSLPQAREGYLNWENPEHRERFLRRDVPAADLWFFDEIHKYRSWLTSLKGFYDSRSASQRILVAGSARLVHYGLSGDSLQGRYHVHRLHPLSAAELGMKSTGDFRQLLMLGGFPESFSCGSEDEARRWSMEYRNLLINEEIARLEQVKDLGNLELLMLKLPEQVGSLLSINALREDLQVSHKAIANWIAILERYYVIFRVSPLGAPKTRAIKKAQKHYHMDWTLVSEPGPRFENLIACHLLKWIHFQQDTLGRDLSLNFFRDTDGREVDFILTENGHPSAAVQCTSSASRVDRSLRYFKLRFPRCAAWQISAAGTRDVVTPEGIRVSPALNLLNTLV